MEKGVMENPVPAPEEVTAAEMVAAREKAGKKVWLVVFEQGGKVTRFISDHPLKPFLQHFKGQWERALPYTYISKTVANGVTYLEVLNYSKRSGKIVLYTFTNDTAWQMTVGQAEIVEVFQ